MPFWKLKGLVKFFVKVAQLKRPGEAFLKNKLTVLYFYWLILNWFY